MARAAFDNLRAFIAKGFAGMKTAKSTPAMDARTAAAFAFIFMAFAAYPTKMEEVGIFRVGASIARRDALIRALLQTDTSAGAANLLKDVSGKDLGDVLLQLLRLNRDIIVPPAVSAQMIEAFRAAEAADEGVGGCSADVALAAAMATIQAGAMCVFQASFSLFAEIAARAEVNHIDMKNLAICASIALFGDADIMAIAKARRLSSRQAVDLATAESALRQRLFRKLLEGASEKTQSSMLTMATPPSPADTIATLAAEASSIPPAEASSTILPAEASSTIIPPAEATSGTIIPPAEASSIPPAEASSTPPAEAIIATLAEASCSASPHTALSAMHDGPARRRRAVIMSRLAKPFTYARRQLQCPKLTKVIVAN